MNQKLIWILYGALLSTVILAISSLLPLPIPITATVMLIMIVYIINNFNNRGPKYGC